MSSSTRNNKRKRQQQKDEDGGSGAGAGSNISAPSTTRRRSRDQRAQAASSKTSDYPDRSDNQDSPSVPPRDSLDGATTVETTSATVDTTMGNAPSAQVEDKNDTTAIEKDDSNTSAQVSEVPASSRNTPPPNGSVVPPKSGSNSTNIPRFHASKSGERTTFQQQEQHTAARSLRSSPFDDGSSSQEGAAAAAADTDEQHLPLHIFAAQIAAQPREKRLEDLIAHRSLLLDRVRACRASAEKRLGETKLSSALPASTQDPGKELDEKEEKAAFLEMTKKANSMPRRIKVDGDAEKRTSLSLRRGTSVGKKMNAALSSLAPGSSAAAAAAAAAVTSGVNATKSAQAVPYAAAAGLQTGPTKSARKSISPKFGATTTPPPKFPSNQQSAFNPSTTAARGPASKAPRTTPNSGGPTGNAPPSARPGGANPSLTSPSSHLSPSLRSPNRLTQLQPQVPRVYFPEAADLREQRDRIREKLRALLERQQHVQEDSPIRRVGSSDDDSRVGITSPGRSILHSPPQQHPPTRTPRRRGRIISGLEIQPPILLPDRRRTHWDTVMQEMSWLASDFIQERQWKAASARVLSSEVLDHRLLKQRSTPTLEVESGGSHHSATNDIEASKKSSAASKRKKSQKATEDVDSNSKSDTADKKPAAKKVVSQKESFKKPSKDDVVHSKCNGKVASAMIAEVNIAIQKGGATEPSDKYHLEGLQRFRRTRKECRQELGLSLDDVTSDDNEEMAVDDDNDGNQKVLQEEPTIESITERIEELHKIGKSRHKSAVREYANALESKQKINLHAAQKNMVDFVEKLWEGELTAGAVLAGLPTSGKTYATATILWKQRSNGPQLVVCPAKNMFRWKHELEQFSNVRALLFGPSGGITSPSLHTDIHTLKSNDVAICEYGGLEDVKKTASKHRISFHSVVVDCRHPLGLHQYSDSVEVAFPSQLFSSKWWDCLMSLLDSDDTRRLFIDYDVSNPLSSSKTRLEHRVQLGVFAKWTACVIGLDTFRSRASSIERQVLVWARKKGKREVVDKLERVRKCLQEAIDPLTFDAEEEIVTLSELQWDLRKCPMSVFQRQEYERCCFDVRGALSSKLSERTHAPSKASETFQAVTSALFRLRQYCFHPNSIQLLAGCDVGSAATFSLQRSVANPSQPDAKAAYDLVSGSSKLVELVSIMANEANYRFDTEKTIELALAEALKDDTDHEGGIPKKVVIIASLWEIRHLVSLFLNSVGIGNILLPCNDASQKNGSDWSHAQRSLARLSTDVGDDGEAANRISMSNVVITSPLAFGMDEGLGVEGAEMIIVLDTDWSGRDGGVLNVMVKRWLARNALVDRDIDLVRLVCENSIEEHIFFEDGLENDDICWPVSNDGCRTLPDSDENAMKIYNSSMKRKRSAGVVPSVCILKERGKLLSNVLAASSIMPPTLFDGNAATFLPRGKDDESERAIEMRFLRQFMKNEEESFRFSESTKDTSGRGSSFIQKEQCDATALCRRDLGAMPSFEFLQRIAQAQSMIKIPGGDGTPILLSQLAEASMMEQSNDGPTKSPGDDDLSSLLVYKPGIPLRGNILDDADGKQLKRRFNSYAKAFSIDSNGISIGDGNQGNEALIFFPPLFPLLEDSAKRARHDYYISSLQPVVHTDGRENPIVDNSTINEQASVKRKQEDLSPEAEETRMEKRSKNDSQTIPENGIRDATESTKVTPPQTNKTVAEKKTIPNQEAVPRVDQIPLSPMEEDFGLLGSGAIARPVDSASFSSYDAARIGGFNPSTDRFDFVSFPIPCDAEETKNYSFPDPQETMGDMILFVKKQNATQLSSRHLAPQLPFRNHDTPGSVAQMSSGLSSNGTDSGMKKKRTQSHMAAAFTRVAGGPGGWSPVNGNSRKNFRRGTLASYQSREKNTGLSMFDSYRYKFSAMRVERRVTERLDQWLWKSAMSYDVGPGIPIGLKYDSSSHITGQRSWLNYAETLSPESKTGDWAKALAKLQRNALLRSSVAPSRVDFGPFEVGFLAAPSGMTGLSSQRIRVGVSLPMGVKITQPSRENTRPVPWLLSDEMFLKESVKIYGKNWLLVAGAMSGMEHVVFKISNGQVSEGRSVARSARECRDKWHDMVQANPDLAEESQTTKARSVSGKESSNDGWKVSVVESKHHGSVIVDNELVKSETTETPEEDKPEKPSKEIDEKKADEDGQVPNYEITKTSAVGGLNDEEMVDVDAAVPATMKPKSRSKFLAAISLAKAKKRVIPITIPGVVSGQPPNQPVPSHPSHIQAVQTSITAQWAQGRTEMWPLQILDLADKQRHAARAAAMQRVPNGPATSSRLPPHGGGSVPSLHRAPPPSGRPHHGHGPYPPVPATGPRPVVPSRGGPIPGSSSGSPPQHMHPHHHADPHHRSPPVVPNSAQAYVPAPSAASASGRAPPTSSSHSIQKPRPDVAKPSFVVQHPPPSAAAPPPAPAAAAPAPPPAAAPPAPPANPEAATKSG